MEGLRTCWNYKSRTHPDVPCSRETLFGDFCSYHHKHPHRFMKNPRIHPTNRKRRALAVLRRFARLCRVRLGLLAAKRQGLNAPSTNQTELISMEPVETIYPPYRFSFCEKGFFWTFDVRALLAARSVSTAASLSNPYTCSVLSEETVDKLQKHVQWLNQRRYNLNYSVTSLTHQQKVTELCLLLDSHGYWTNVDWFCSMTVPVVHEFTNRLDALWMDELGLTDRDRLRTFPPWSPDHPYLVPLIRGGRIEPVLNQLLTFLFRFLRAAEEKEVRTLACVYVLKALASVNARVRTSYPWLL